MRNRSRFPSGSILNQETIVEVLKNEHEQYANVASLQADNCSEKDYETQLTVPGAGGNDTCGGGRVQSILI